MIVSSRFILLGTLAVVIPLLAYVIWCFFKRRNTRRKAKFRKPGRKERAQYQKVNAKCSGEEEEAIEYISVAVKSERVAQKGKEGNIINEVLNRVAKRDNHQEGEFTPFQEDSKMRKKKNGKGKKSVGKSNKVGMFSCKSPQTGSDGDEGKGSDSIGQKYAEEEKEAPPVGASRMDTRQTGVGTDGRWIAGVMPKDQCSEKATNTFARRNLFNESDVKSQDSRSGRNDSQKKQFGSHGPHAFDNICYDAVQQKKSGGRSDAKDNDTFGVGENADAKRGARKRPDQQRYVPPKGRKDTAHMASKGGSADTAGKRSNPSNREAASVKKPFEKEVLNEDEKQTVVKNIDHGNIIDDSNGFLPNDQLEKTVYENVRPKEKADLPGTLYENVNAPNPTKPTQFEVAHAQDESVYENTRNLRYSRTGRSGSQQDERADSVPQTKNLQPNDNKARDAESVNRNLIYDTVSPVKAEMDRQDSNSGRTVKSKAALEIKIQSKVNKDDGLQKQSDNTAKKFKRSTSQKAPPKKEEIKARQAEALRRSHSEERLLETERRSDVVARGATNIRVHNGIIFCGDSKGDGLVNRTAAAVKQSSEKESGRNLSREKDQVVKAKRPESITAPLLIDEYAASEWKGETVKADKIRRGYERVKRETGLICIRRIRGDNYCALRAVLFKALSSGIDIMMRFRGDDDILELPRALMAKNCKWIREWSFAKRLPLVNNSVVDTLTDCLDVLQETVALSTSCYNDNKRYEIILDKMNGSEQEEVKLFEAVKFLMLYNSIKLHEGMLSGQETSILPILLFARDTSTEPRSFMKNHLNHIGDSGGMDQLEMILLGHTLKIVIIVMRLHQVDEQDFIAQFPDDLEDPEDKIYLVAEDDRHYNALSEEG